MEDDFRLYVRTPCARVRTNECDGTAIWIVNVVGQQEQQQRNGAVSIFSRTSPVLSRFSSIVRVSVTVVTCNLFAAWPQ